MWLATMIQTVIFDKILRNKINPKQHGNKNGNKYKGHNDYILLHI